MTTRLPAKPHTSNVSDLARAERMLQRAHALGVEIGCRDTSLLIADKHKVLGKAARQKLLEAQDDLLRLLREGPAALLTQREFQAAGRVILLWSEVLRETVLIVSDDAPDTHPVLQQYPSLVVYRVSEIRHLAGAGPDALQMIHEAKLRFGPDTVVVGVDAETGRAYRP